MSGQVNVSFPQAWYDYLKAQADAGGVSLAALVAGMVRRQVKDARPQVYEQLQRGGQVPYRRPKGSIKDTLHNQLEDTRSTDDDDEDTLEDTLSKPFLLGSRLQQKIAEMEARQGQGTRRDSDDDYVDD